MHLTEGLGIAINTGDLALSMVNGAVMRDPYLTDAQKVRVVTELIEMTRRTIEGQALDLGWARDKRYDITPDDYLCMAIHKTAHYSGAVPLAVGAIVGGGTEEQIAALREYGLATGLAFQIQDDLLNIEGDPEIVHALKHSDKGDRLVEILSSKTTDVAELAEAVSIMREAGSLDYARDYASSLTDKAKEKLLQEIDESNARALLISMADYFINRMK